MKRNMKEWVAECINNPVKKAMPILSFPGVQIIGHTVDELVKSGELQAQCMKAIADRFDTGVAFSLMDLSVEAEAFGSLIRLIKSLRDEPDARCHCLFARSAQQMRRQSELLQNYAVSLSGNQPQNRCQQHCLRNRKTELVHCPSRNQRNDDQVPPYDKFPA